MQISELFLAERDNFELTPRVADSPAFPAEGSPGSSRYSSLSMSRTQTATSLKPDRRNRKPEIWNLQLVQTSEQQAVRLPALHIAAGLGRLLTSSPRTYHHN